MTDEIRIVQTLKESALLRRADRVIGLCWRAAAQSRTSGAARRVLERWSALPVSTRDLRAGGSIAAAAATHVALVSWQERPAGWLWLLIPVFAVSVGVLLIGRARGRAKG